METSGSESVGASVNIGFGVTAGTVVGSVTTVVGEIVDIPEGLVVG